MKKHGWTPPDHRVDRLYAAWRASVHSEGHYHSESLATTLMRPLVDRYGPEFVQQGFTILHNRDVERANARLKARSRSRGG